MEVLITLLVLVDIMLAVLLVVATMARLDRTYASSVRLEYERKAILRGEDRR